MGSVDDVPVLRGSMPLNFRSLSSYTGRDGRRVRPDCVYRSGAPDAVEAIAHLDLGLLADLRHPDERPHDDDGTVQPWPCTIVRMPAASTGEAPHLGLMDGTPLDDARIEDYYLSLYRSLPLNASYQDLFGQFFRAVARSTGSILIFCAAGKDRTGILTGLTGRILGLSDDDIMADYLMSNDDASLYETLSSIVCTNAAQTSGQILSDGLVRRVLGVSPAYLQAAFQQIDDQYGGLTSYLSAMNVTKSDVDAIRNRLLV